jgi:hypothetical protein
LRARISGKHCPKVKVFAKFDSPYQIYLKSQKSPQKSSFGRFSFFTAFFVIFDSLTFGFCSVTPLSIISSGRMGSQ